ncbi:MAG: hypothetical protein PHT12_00420 [Patescibacteria group bacterium]|nr:hypothetical protein [Patescibacteria group bacterium]
MFREGAPNPEMKETNPLQAKVDRAFELVALSGLSDEFLDERRDQEVFEAMESLLAEPITANFGEGYELSYGESYRLKHADNATLARRESHNTRGEFEPTESLMVIWGYELDLPSGRLQINYSVFGKDRDSDGWDRWLYKVPVLENQERAFVASPDAIRKIYERLEAEHAERVEKYEAEADEYEKAAAWVTQNAKKKFRADDPLPDALSKWHWYIEGKTWSAEFDTRPSHEGEININIWNDHAESVDDIWGIPEPLLPERRYPPRPESQKK